MSGRYSLVLWAGPQNISEEDMAELSFNTLTAISSFGDELSPVYYSPTRKKRDTKHFNLSKTTLLDLIKRSVNKEGNREFLELGRNFGFFSSFNDDESCGISFCLGASAGFVNNSLILDFPRTHFSGLDSRKEELADLFKRLITLFHPYFAFALNSLNNQLSDIYWKDGKPSYVHWMNYYDQATAERIGLDKVKAQEDVETLDDGYFFKLQDEPIDVDNPQHLQRQKAISEQLGLLGG